MADENYYSLKETAEKLEKSEVEVRQLAKDGKLKEQFTGEEVFYLAAEVDVLAADTSETIALAPEDTSAETQEPTPEETTGEIELQLEPEDTAGETQVMPSEEETSKTKDDTVGLSTDEDEISLAPELDETIATDDTRLDGEGINVLTETDTAGFDITSDTMAETALPEDAESLEKIEEDVNLDSFGSGSGLLDLSLQADDTSLGGVLDEIYAGEDEEALPAGSAAIDLATGTGLMPDEDFGEAEPAAAGVAMPMYAEAAPDTSSNLFGIMLLIPFAAVIFMAIAIVSAYNKTKPGILAAVEGNVLIVIGSAAGLAIIIMLAAFFMGGEKSAKPKKAKAKKKKSKKKKKGALEVDEEIEEDIAI